MHVTLRSVFLFIILTAAATVSFAQNQFIVEVEDESGKPVRGAAVTVNCGDGVVRNGVTDAKGEASVASSTAETCYLSVSARGFVPIVSPLSLKEYPTGIVLSVQKAEPGSELKIELYDQNNKPVRGASVNISCGDGVARRGVTDVKGMFEPPILPSSRRCFLTISGNDIAGHERELPFTRNGNLSVEVTRKPTAMKQAAAQKGSACPPERTLKDGSCGTAAQARAEAQSDCQRSVRGGIAFEDTSGGFRCGCVAGSAIVDEQGDRRCETIRNIQVMAAAACKKTDPDLVASPVDSEGQYECRCPDDKQWRDATRNAKGGCVSIAHLDERANYCESQISGSAWTEDSTGKLGCFCPPETKLSRAEKKCVPANVPGQSCPPGRTRPNGSCATEEEFEAEFNRSCERTVRGGIAVPDEEGGFRCGCRNGFILLSDSKNGQRCESRQNLAIEAANDCKRRDPELVPTDLDILGRYNCVCPPGKQWEEASEDSRGRCVSDRAQACDRTMAGSISGKNSRGEVTCVCPEGYVESHDRKRCVSKPVETKDSRFVGTWNGNRINKGVTIIINKDFTGVFIETRPGWPTYPDGGKFTWRVYPGKPNWIILSVGDENMLVNGAFVKAGTILKLLGGYLIDQWSQSYSK